MILIHDIMVTNLVKPILNQFCLLLRKSGTFFNDLSLRINYALNAGIGKCSIQFPNYSRLIFMTRPFWVIICWYEIWTSQERSNFHIFVHRIDMQIYCVSHSVHLRSHDQQNIDVKFYFKRLQSIKDRTDVTQLIYRIVRRLLFYRQHASFHCLMLLRHFNWSFIMAKTKNQRRKKATRFENHKKIAFPFMLFYLF